MKERLLDLAKAAPIVSKKYEHLICVAGITDNGEWKRIYPVPFELFWEQKGFKKKTWIEYELQENSPSDHRKESRKITPNSVKNLPEEKYSKIHEIIEKKLTTLEDLNSKGHREVSLGVIKPKIIDFCSNKNKHKNKLQEKTKQTTLTKKSAVKIDVPDKTFSYIFNCSDSCPKQHTILCEDWEVAELYRKCKKYQEIGKYPDEKTVLEKVKNKMPDEMLKKQELYFVVGTHFRFDTYIIIGVIYPRKNDKF